MEFRIDRDVFAAALGKLQGVVDRKTSQAVLSNVLIQSAGGASLRLAATDLDVTLLGGYAAEILTEGAVCIPAKSLYEIVRALPPGPVNVKSAANHYVEIRSGQVDYKIVGEAAEKFPSLPSADDVKGFATPRAALMELIDATLFSVSTDDTRPNLNGALVKAAGQGRLMFVSTDGHRLSKAVRPVDADLSSLPPAGVIIPRKGLHEVRRALDDTGDTVFVGLQGNNAVFRSEREVLFVRLIDGAFPDFESVIRKNDTWLQAVVERLALLDALRRVSLVSTERTRGVRVNLVRDAMDIATSNPDVGEAHERLPIEVAREGTLNGEGIEVGYNARYVMEALSALSSDEVLYETKDASSPTIIRNRGEEDSFYVVMPMRF